MPTTPKYSLENVQRLIEEVQHISEMLFSDPKHYGAYPQDMPQQAVDASMEFDEALGVVRAKLRTVKWAVKKYDVKLNNR